MNKLVTSFAVLASLLTGLAQAQTPGWRLDGQWMFVEDSTVIEFVPCGDAICARVRGLPDKLEPGEQPPACGLEVLRGFKPNGSRWVGEALDPESNERYRARLQRGRQADELELVVSALGGLVSESMLLVPAREFKPCR